MARFDDLPPEILRTIITTAFEVHMEMHGSRYDFWFTQATRFYLFPLATINRSCCELGFEVAYAWILQVLRCHARDPGQGTVETRNLSSHIYEKRVQSWISAKEEQQLKWEKMILFVQRNGMQAAEKVWSDF